MKYKILPNRHVICNPNWVCRIAVERKGATMHEFVHLMNKHFTVRSKPAVLLSGGIDSSVILYHLVESMGSARGIRTYSMCFGGWDQEWKTATRVAEHFKTIHTTVHFDRQHYEEVLLPKVNGVLPEPRYNVWPYFLIEAARHECCKDVYIGEGGDEIFGYPDRSYMEGWRGQLTYILPTWKAICAEFRMELHTPFISVNDEQNRIFGPDYMLGKYYKPPDKVILREAYLDLLPEWILMKRATPPSFVNYAKLRYTRKQLQEMAATAWLEVRGWKVSRNESR